MQQITLKIDGMMCGMCESHINESIRNAFPVKKVTSSHTKGETVILTEENIEETKLVEIFRDYLENMEESCFYSKEESVAMIRQIIDYLKKERTETE